MIYYNKQNNGFYNSELNEIPANSIEITQEYHAELLQKQSIGLIIQPDKNGYPITVERVLTAIAINESKKQLLIKECNEKIAILQDIIDLDMQESNEEEQLKQLKKYRILLTRVDTSDINAVFPEQPH